jgi:cytidylate kinase
MAGLTIISGSPASGKSTLAGSLAAAHSSGLHFQTDTFYRFPAHPIDPSTIESQHQNTVIMQAIGRATSAFVEGGYEVYLDGIVGPWFIETLLSNCGNIKTIDYVILSASVEISLERAIGRNDDASLDQVKHMHKAFEKHQGYLQHRLDTTGISAAEVQSQFLAKRERLEFRLSSSG